MLFLRKITVCLKYFVHSQSFELNQINAIDSEEKNLEVEQRDTEATEEHPQNIAVEGGLPDIKLIG